ncbi:putative transport system permease protein, partial [Streptococcus thermophilus CNCM I-1630]
MGLNKEKEKGFIPRFINILFLLMVFQLFTYREGYFIALRLSPSWVGIIGSGLFGISFWQTETSVFCMTGGFRDMYIARNNTLFYAFLIAITVESIGVLSLIKLGIIGNPYEDFPRVKEHIVGSYLFGIGIVLAGDVPQTCCTKVFPHSSADPNITLFVG